MSQVSVIIAAHNALAYITQALDSLRRQTAPPDQIVVVDDGSTDGTAAAVEAWSRQHAPALQLIRQAKSGVSRARNAGLDRATGRYLAFLDADDLFLPGKLAAQAAALESQPQAAGVYCRYFDFQHEPDDLGRRVSKEFPPESSVSEILLRQHIPISTAMIRRELAGGVRFDERTGHGEDTLYMAQVRLAGPVPMLEEPLLAKRVHAVQASRGGWHAVRNAESRLRFLREQAGVLGPEAGKLEFRISQTLVHYLEHRYWRRELEDLSALRDEALRICPQAMARSFLQRRRIHPRWVYRVWDLVRGNKSEPGRD